MGLKLTTSRSRGTRSTPLTEPEITNLKDSDTQVFTEKYILLH